MAIRTVDFLPDIFQTTPNKQFLNATLDQLVQEPAFKKTQGYIGRRVGPGVNPNDYYVLEPDATRANYQLEPGVISLKPDTEEIQDAITYPGITDALAVQGANTTKSDRLYTSEYYTWDPFVSFDKFVNYSQYYWLPAGPDDVDVYATAIPLTDNFVVTRNTNNYNFSGILGNNPVITLVRGGNYTFDLNQTGNNFWIQSDPGVNGRLPYAPNISSRDVLGVINNGEDLGTVSFYVPFKNAQQFYYDLTSIGNVDLLTDLQFDQINNVYLSEFLATYGGIDGITDLNNRTVVFTNQIYDPQDGGWLITSQFDPLTPGNNGQPGSFDSLEYDLTVPIVDPDTRYSVWVITYQYDTDGNAILKLSVQRPCPKLNKFTVLFGTQWASTQWYRDAEGYFEEIPLLTAVKDVLWYQDGTNPDIFGQIRLVEEADSSTINVVTDILGKTNYTSPNGVVFTNNLKVQFLNPVVPASYANQEYYVAGVGTAIQLLPVSNYVTPETYTQSATIPFDSTPFDVGNFDSSLNQPLIPDYLTIALDSPDLNAWSRSNRWFHIDVINASATYNNTTPVLNNAFRARRPILEFRGGTRLYEMGTQGKQPVDIIDFVTTDALSTINGTVGYGVDGYTFIAGTRVIFARDTDPDVRDKIYVVEFVTLSDDGSSFSEPVINLVPASDADVFVDQTVVCLSGTTLQGISFYYDGTQWIRAQQKTSTNQAPLFNVYDSNGYSLSDPVAYPSSTFAGSKLFSYALGPGLNDTVLGFPLKYLSINNIGDIVFDNNLYADTFLYVKDNVSYTKNISIGFVRQYANRTIYQREIGWQTAAVKSKIYQQFSFVYAENTPLLLDVAALPVDTVPSVKVYIDSTFQDPGTYTYVTTSNTTTITFPSTTVIVPGQIIEVLILSDQASAVAFYQVPINLENNPLNENAGNLTLGTIRTHYDTIGQNLVGLTGKINGANNSRDLGNIIPFGLNILQQSSPMTLAGYFLRSADYNIFASLEYNSREYEKYKAQLLNTAITNDYVNMTVPEILTAVITDLIAGRTSSNPFYWSDMLPGGNVYTESTTVVGPITGNTFDTTQVYNYTSANYLGLLVYVNDRLLTRDIEYVVSTDSSTLTITIPLAVGDTVVIQEYAETYGTFIPNTPTKLGLYPAYIPEIYLDTTYVTPRRVIRGHDGSITVAFDDFRDQLLLEFETRIYNNLKLDGNPVPLTATEVVPGQFRTTDYTLGEITDIESQDFLTWVGWNKLDYKSQDYLANNAFTWNYSTAGNKLSNNEPLTVGAWRGIYNYFYDTISPNTRPWEMLGFTVIPAWWIDEYGPAPYTSGNLVLWDDLAAGLVRDPVAPYVLPQYARPELTQVIPAGSEGALLPPIETVVSNFNSNNFQRNWAVGDDAPVENAWRTSSAYPFAIMRMLVLTRPAEFFSLFADRDLYRYDVELGQYLYNGRYRLDANGVEIYGNGVSKASYIDWIVDYNRVSGINSTDALTADLKNLDVRLCYRMAAFTGKNLLEIYTEKSSPNSLNSSLLLPDESYNLLFYKNVPFDQLTYSSIIVQSTASGWAVYGYSTTQPYFNILVSQVNGVLSTISAGGFEVRVPVTYSNQVVQVPYGYTFTNRTLVADFLLSYGALLQQQGLVFDQMENGYQLDWNQMVSEFLYWSGQGWAEGSIINLNPGATQVIVERPGAIVDSIALQTTENMVLNADRTPFATRDLVVERLDNTFTLRSLTADTINYFHIKFTSYENMIVLDNESIFADLIYYPATGARQSRIRLIGSTTQEWNGQLNAPGFILNQDNVKEWQPLRKYARGEIVLYKNFYYSAVDIVQPKPKFDFNDWTRSDYTKIQQGLLPNLPNKSDQLANTYNVYNANLELNQDLFAYNLIGFKPREYMVSLNLDSTSQVNLYRQFLGTKGTTRAAEIFTFADLGRGVSEYQIYENWAVQRGVYGANANRSFYEMRLNEALLTSNPSLVQVVIPGESSLAEQTVLLSNLWNQSYKITSPDILTTTLVKITDTALPSAGYVNIDDVDITVFNIDNTASLAGNLDNVNVGSIVWVAKINDYDWGIYRTAQVPGIITQVDTNLNGTAVVTFNQAHGLVADNILLIKYFGSGIDGVYRVLNIPSIFQVTVTFNFLQTDQIVATGTGTGFTLQTQRIAQGSDIITLPYVNDLIPGSRAWIDDNGAGLWQVVEKQEVFQTSGQLEVTTPVADSQFGTSVAQAHDNVFAFVGAPGYGNTQSGALYTYVRTSGNPFTENSIIECNNPGAYGFGSSVSIGYQTWGAVGAPTSIGSDSSANSGYVGVIYRFPNSPTFLLSTLLTVPDDTYIDSGSEFGTSVVVSPDEQWMYIGAPGINQVFAYGLVEIQGQLIEYVTDGVQSNYQYSNDVIIDSGEYQQLFVVLNDQLLTYTTDYTVTDTTVVLNSTPVQDLVLRIGRRVANTFTGNGVTQTFSLNEYLYSAINIYSFKVEVNGIVQRPNIDYTFSNSTRNLTFDSAHIPTGTIDVSTQSYYTYVETLSPSGLVGGERFGQSISCSTDGRQIMIGCPNDTYDSVNDAGSVYIYDRSVQRFIVTDATQTVYQVDASLVSPTSVILNNQFLTNSAGNVSGDYTVTDTNEITLTTPAAVGDILEIDVNTFTLLQVIGSDTPIQSANFGQAVDLCINNCSLYTGAPQDSSVLPEAGSVERQVNQSRVYGLTTSTVNARLNPGNTIRINNMEVVLSTPTAWNSALTYTIGTIVEYNQGLWIAISAVPVGTALSDTTYWQPSSWGAVLAQDINNSTVPNVIAYAGAVTGTATFGLLTISVKNTDAALPGNKLSVLPGLIGNIFESLVFETFVYTQTINSPYPVAYAGFGSAVNIDTSTLTLTVGAPRGNLYRPTTFDAGQTYFDSKTTIFNGPLIQSGAVYTYDYFASSEDSVTNPGKFAFGQQVYDSTVTVLDQYGTSIDYSNGILLAGSPKDDLGDSSLIAQNYGAVSIFNNPDLSPAWTVTYVQQPVVDIALINGVFTYDRITSAKTAFFDFIDPLQGKILGAARQNINYIGAVDPAAYNVGDKNNNGRIWAATHEGEMWWDTNSVRFIDPNQDDIVYAARRWAQIFPGSSVDVYQWVASTVPPANYTGPGTPRNLINYCVTTGLNTTGVFGTTYYFWVKNIVTINTTAGKTLSSSGVARYIADPRSSGIPYVAFVSPSATAIYNGTDQLSAFDTVISIEFDRQLTDDNVHVQYDLLPQDRADGFLPDNLYQKLQDSFCGVDSQGALVPDPTLSPAQRYGVQFRPRQSMFENRFLALQNYLEYANAVLLQFPISEIRNFSLLNSSEAEPQANTGAWNKRVANIEELSYQDFTQVAVGYKYLVVSDSTQGGLWTVYTVTAAKTFATLFLSRVQNYDTRNYWEYVTWYLPGYNSSVKIIAEVANVATLDTLSLTAAPVGSSVKVTANSQGKFEIYLRTNTGWDRVGLQDGTIQFLAELWDYALGRYGFDVEVFDLQHFDQEPVVETRKIIQAINEELLIGDLLIERNRALILMFNFVLSEFEAPEWLTKTSLIDVDHKIRQLVPYQTYQRDNQDFVLNYIQEVKPYHVQIREFNLIYNGLDVYQGSMADFDLPAFYNTVEVPNQYMSPILTPYTLSTATGTGHPSTYSDVAPDSLLWQAQPYSFWFNNYTLSIQDVIIADGGSGYTVAPQLTVTGDCVTQATMTAVVNSAGNISQVIVTDSGSGYTSTAIVTVSGGNGTGGQIVAVMGNNLVRSINTTIKYDRYQYVSTIVPWEANVSYDNGTQVRYDNRVWQADSGDSSPVQSATFDPDQWILVAASSLSGVDRTMGFYVPGPDQPGLDLPLLIDGVDYPGVQVSAPTFSQNTGFDVGNFDINPFDNISYGPEGRPTYDPAILDAIYESSFLDPYLGTRATDINVDGGEFVGPYESHAPEELVPGAIFDTMDFRVYSRQFNISYGDGTTTGPYYAPTASLDVEVAVNNIIISPDEYTVDYGDSTTAAVTFDTAPASGAVIVVLESDPITGLELRIFQDMRGVQATYRMTPATTTTLTQTLYTNSDIVYVDDAGALAEPDLDNNIWGVLTVNGERIMYRERNTITNTVSSLLRGTAGTAVDLHPTGSIVYNLNRDNLAPVIYQDRIVGSETLANGTTTIFTADVNLSLEDSTFDEQAILVYVGGLLQTSGYTVTGVDTVTIEFDTAPTAGYQVTIQIRQGLGWYGAGSTTAYDGVGLQYTDTLAAQFFRG
jgi:hypothetical protein